MTDSICLQHTQTDAGTQSSRDDADDTNEMGWITAMTARRLDRSRRGFLTIAGACMAGGLAGCLGSDSSSEPEYAAGEIPEDIDGEERTTEEMATAEDLAEQEPQPDLAPLSDLSITDHEFVFEGGHTGSTVQGTAENAGETRLSSAEVRVRVYNDDGEMLGIYLDTTSDFDSGTEWSFEVILLESPEDLADYDITVVGLPD